MSKQFLMMVEEEGLERFKAMFRDDVKFLEIQGMDINGNAGIKLLCTPVQPPVNPVMALPVPEEQPPAA